MSYRVKVTLPDAVGDELEQFAVRTGEPASTIAAHFVRAGLAATDGEPARMRVPTRARVSGGKTPPWLEPPRAESRAWRAEAWAAVLALCARYPKEFASLEGEWWRRNARVETLCALAAWRDAIDQGGQDPRDELAFQAQLTDLQRLLEQTPGVGADVFTPRAPPAEWLEP